MSWVKNHSAKIRVASVVVISGLALSACATNSYVNEQIATVNTRIDQLDAKVTSAASRMDAADQANASAAASANSAAQGAATDARTANQRLDQLTGRVDALEQAKTPARKPRG